MSQTFIDDCFASGHVAQTDMQSVENNFAALKSCFSGPYSPPNKIAGMWWFDTVTNILKLCDESTNWLSVWDFANNKPIITNLSNEITGAMISSAIKDAAAGTVSLRSLGTSSVQAAPGNDTRFAAPSAGTTYNIFTVDDTERSSSQGGSSVPNYLSVSLDRHYDQDSHQGCIALKTGTITVYAQHKLTTAAGGHLAYLRILKNAAVQVQWTTASGGVSPTYYQARSVNISVVPGDQIIFQQAATYISNPAKWRYLRVYSGTLTSGVSW